MRRYLPLLVLALCPSPLEAGKEKRACPEFSFQLADGSTQDLKRYRGKVVLVEVMLTTCPDCKRCAQTIEKIYREYGPKGFQPVAVAVNDGALKLLAAYRRQFGLTYPVGYAERDPVIKLLRHSVFQPMFVPQLVFIDREGVIRAKYAGTDFFFRNEEENIRKLVEELLAAPPG